MAEPTFNLIHSLGKPAFRVYNAPEDTDLGIAALADFIVRFDSEPRYRWEKIDERGTAHKEHTTGGIIQTPPRFRLRFVVDWGVLKVGTVEGGVLTITDYADFAGSEYEFLQYLDNHRDDFGTDGTAKLEFRMNHQRPTPLLPDDETEWDWEGQDLAYEVAFLDFTPDSFPRPGISDMKGSILLETQTYLTKFPYTFAMNRKPL
jgi:hypothetical protein